jgi:pilus assembly protein CpaB
MLLIDKEGEAMKTKKLWIWSFIFALGATVVLYLVISSNNNQKVVKTDAPVVSNTGANGNTKEPTQTTPNPESPQTQTTGTEGTEEDKGNELLPIGEGKRAMTIQANDVQGIAGFIKPGSHVDVVAKLTVPADVKPGQHPVQSIMIQNAKVLALGHAADDKETIKRYQLVTLEVSPTEALTLGFTDNYEFYLLLRQEDDKKLEPDHTHLKENQLHEGVFEK